MSAAHTPGPWAVNPFDAKVDAFDTGKPLPVCAMLWPTDERTEETTYANANLISAAPDMLEALERLCRNADDLDRFGLSDEFEQAERAIRKAKGESCTLTGGSHG